MIRLKTLGQVALVAGAMSLLSAPAAHAIATLRISDGSTTLTLTDGDNDGAISYSGAFGSTWNLNFMAAVSKPGLGTATNPKMDVSSLNISNGAGTLSIWFSDDFFGPTTGGMKADIGGVMNGGAGSSLSYNTYADASNVIFGTAENLTSQSFSGPGPFGGTDSGDFSTSPFPFDYSLFQKIEITHTAAGNSSFNAELQVPDGGATVALLGFVLLGVEGLRRKLRFA